MLNLKFYFYLHLDNCRAILFELVEYTAWDPLVSENVKQKLFEFF
jgi:hypothetical protein